MRAAEPLVASVQPQGFAWEWSIVLPMREWGGGDWRAWVASEQAPRRAGRVRGVPGATVEVVDRFLDERRERILELNTTWAPALARSFQLGWRSSYTAQILSEFMGMTAANLRPPSVPSVFYNGLIPYWVLQGWESPAGATAGSSPGFWAGSSTGRVVISNTPSDRPMILYPGKR
jgi:hypothetical protein